MKVGVTMLNNEKSNILEKNITERINQEFPQSSLKAGISKLITKTIIIALQEYEKLNQDS